MKIKPIKHHGTTIILDGIPYSLCTVEYEQGDLHTDVCRVCDLKDLCQGGELPKGFLPLCIIENSSYNCCFQQNWDIFGKYIREIL